MTQQNLYLRGKCLIAMPTMSDPRFHKAVILICTHNENGAMGLMINHPLRTQNLDDLIGQLPFDPAEAEQLKQAQLPLFSGGPVESARGFLLHSTDMLHKDTIRINNDFGVTGTLDGLKDIALRQTDGSKKLFVLGHAAWTAGQLEAELKDHAWLVCDATPAIVFHDDNDKKWTLATQTLGFDPAWLSTQTGQA